MNKEVKFCFLLILFTINYLYANTDIRKNSIIADLKTEQVVNLCDRIITILPFVELFSQESSTLNCWTVRDNNQDNITWELPYAPGGINPNLASSMIVNQDNALPDDWLISPRIRVTGNQQLRFSYHMITPVGSQNSTKTKMRIVVNKLGSVNGSFLLEEFNIEVTPILEYIETGRYTEVILKLVDRHTGIAIEGDINIAFHMTGIQSGRERIYIDNFIVQDIPNPVNNPVDLPYGTDFEDNPPFNFDNDLINAWSIDSAVQNGGENSLYITNDGGISNTYTRDTLQVSHAFIDFNIPLTREQIHIDFDLRSLGFPLVEAGNRRAEFYDTRFNVRLLNGINHQSVTHIPYEHYSLGWSLIRSLFDDVSRNGLAEFERVNIVIPWTEHSEYNQIRGYIGRLDFEWVSGGDSEERLAVAIDNLNIYTTCVIVVPDSNLFPNIARPYLVFSEEVTSTSFEIEDVLFLDLTANLISLTDYQYDIIVSEVALNLDQQSIPTYSDVDLTSPLTLDGLFANTEYYVYFRPVCTSSSGRITIGEWDVSRVLTRQIPAELPFFENFEGNGASQWSVYPRSRDTNSWFVGNAVSSTGNQSLYISDDEGENYRYLTTATSNAFGIRDIIIPLDASELHISYDYKVNGEKLRGVPQDYFRVKLQYLQNGVDLLDERIGEPFYVYSDGWQTENVVYTVPSMIQGEVVSLSYEWNNNNLYGTQPPAAIDNVRILTTRCLSPTNLQATFVEDTNTIELSWSPQGTENRWMVYVVEQGGDAPSFEEEGILVEDNPLLSLSNIEEGRYYHFYVRAICGPNESEIGFWVGPETYSYSVSSNCIGISKEAIDLPTNASGDYIICDDSPHKETLTVHFSDSRQTNDYYTKLIEYTPPYPFIDDGRQEVEGDDSWSDVIDLGFNFCFFENNYTKLLISTNGVLTFSIDGIVENGLYEPQGESTGIFNQTLINGNSSDAPFVDAIFNVMQDLDLANSPESASINYKMYGSFPCRTFVFNVHQVALKGQAYLSDAIESTTQTSQVVLYENTNAIDIFIKNRPVVRDDNPHNNANGVVGIINNDGSHASVPYQRNTGSWEAKEEAWRFVPKGESVVDFKWLKEGVEFSSAPSIDVLINESVTYVARAIYQLCGNNEVVVEQTYTFSKENLDVSKVSDYYVCRPVDVDSLFAKIDIEPITDHVISELNVSSEEYRIEYFYDEALSQPINDVFQIQKNQVVYVKLTNLSSGCSRSGNFNIILKPAISISKFGNIEACKEILLPELVEGEAFYSEPLGKGEKYNSGTLYNQLGTSQVYIYKIGTDGCSAQTSFNITIFEESKVDVFLDQVLECETFVLPKLSANNHYFSQPNGRGIELKPEMEILVPMTIYIYAINGSETTFCFEESSFKIDYIDCPIPKGLSPNGDGLNDSFNLSNYGITEIQIFNRDGVEVYSYGKGYRNQWVGQNKSGKLLPSGIYYYVLISHGKQRTGWVQLNY